MTEAEFREKEKIRKHKWYEQNRKRIASKANRKYRNSAEYRKIIKERNRRSREKRTEEEHQKYLEYLHRYRLGLIPGTKTFKEW